MKGPRILLTGAGGLVGAQVHRRLEEAGYEVHSSLSDPPRRPRLEIPGEGARLVEEIRPRAVVHAAAMSEIAACDREPVLARRVNEEASVELAEAAAASGARMIFFSTDQVYDGRGAPYREDSPTGPLHRYGATKLAAERRVAEACPDSAAIRLALVYGPSPSGRRSASEALMRAAAERRTLTLFEDEIRCPVSAPFVAEAVLRLVESDHRGPIHVAGPEALSRHEFGRLVCRALELPETLLVAARADDREDAGARPRDLRLDVSLLGAVTGLAHPPTLEALRRAHHR